MANQVHCTRVVSLVLSAHGPSAQRTGSHTLAAGIEPASRVDCLAARRLALLALATAGDATAAAQADDDLAEVSEALPFPAVLPLPFLV